MSHMSRMFSRNQFEEACQIFAGRHSNWTWVSARNTGYGYLTRTTAHIHKPPFNTDELEEMARDVIEDDDQTSSECTSYPAVTVIEYVVYSASFNVPAFYFSVHDASGCPLPLAEIIGTSFFKIGPPQGSESNGFSLTVPSTSFPLLSQGEHPTLGSPCWYFHPCETDKAVTEFMQEESLDDEKDRLNRWMEIWLMIVGSVLNV